MRSDQGPVEGQAELGYRLLRRYWRKGLTSEGAKELLRHGFEDMGLSRIFAETMATNTGSRATMAAINMELIRRFNLKVHGSESDNEQAEVEYAISLDHWVSQ